jgi:redox-sensitive bicupin YhaK (pirin superfamily)
MTELRKITFVDSGQTHGPITRLISPSDIGEQLKPFIFLDYFNAEIKPGFGFPMHPHSGIATLTWQPGTDVAYEDTTGQHGVLKAGGLEWMNAGGGAWHKASLLGSGHSTGFQLWVAMPHVVENGPSKGQYVAPEQVAEVAVNGGTVKVLLGSLTANGNAAISTIESHQDMNYFVVQLDSGAKWRYSPPMNHDVAFAVGFSGTPLVNDTALQHSLALLSSHGDIEVAAPNGPIQVLVGTAAKHKWDLVLGTSSVHTSADALAMGLQTISAIGAELRRAGRLA